MSKERELLERALKLADHYIIGQEDLAEEIRDYLAEPEKKRDPLSAESVTEYLKGMQDVGINERIWFRYGVRFAEKHHGVGGEDE